MAPQQCQLPMVAICLISYHRFGVTKPVCLSLFAHLRFTAERLWAQMTWIVQVILL